MNDNPGVELWATAISKNAISGRQIMWRYAKELSAGFDRSMQPDRIIIVWPYASDNGQPGPADHDLMNRFEDALEGVLKGSEVATLALVSTGENLREWIFYAETEASFSERFEAAVEDLPALPIELHVAHDPTWSLYTEFRTSNPNT